MSEIPIPLCVYCNERPGVDSEHIIPRSFFIPPRPSNMLTIPACKECNAAKAKDETYFRDMIVMEAGTEQNPIAAALREGAFWRSVTYGKSAFAKDAVFKGSMKPHYSKAGVYLGDFVSVPVNGQVLINVVSRIVRGFYYHLRDGQRWSCVVSVDTR